MNFSYHAIREDKYYDTVNGALLEGTIQKHHTNAKLEKCEQENTGTDAVMVSVTNNYLYFKSKQA